MRLLIQNCLFYHHLKCGDTEIKSFTLIELIVVIAIIAILAAIIAPNAFRAIEKAKIAKIEGDFKTIKAVVMSYYSDTGTWPPSDRCHSEGGGSDITVETQNFITGENQPAGWDGPYIDRWPRTPFRPEGDYPHEYYNYINNTDRPEGLCPVGVDVYLQVGSCTERIARKIKEDFDGHDFLTTSPYTQRGSIRYYFPPRRILYYVIAIDSSCL